MRVYGRLWGSVVLLTGVLLGGCSEDTPASPGTGLEVTNAVDNFQYQVTDVRQYTHEDTYVWQNTGTVASVNQATTVTGGSVTIVLLDHDGAQMYSRSLADNGTYVSASGTPGSWTIRIVYSSANATVNFRVQKSA